MHTRISLIPLHVSPDVDWSCLMLSQLRMSPLCANGAMVIFILYFSSGAKLWQSQPLSVEHRTSLISDHQSPVGCETK